jgi:hypothetical protein
MRKLTLISAILFILLALSNLAQAGNNLTVSYSPTNITRSMDMAMRGNSFNYLTVQEGTATDTIYEKAKESKPAKLKSPIAALVIAVVPGSVVHGAGHFYAGKTGTAIGLFGAEAVGVVLVLGSGISRLDKTESSDRVDAIEWVGVAMFFGSWLYDVVESPFVVKNRNDKILGKEPFEQ